jgi:hypothetical protein
MQIRQEKHRIFLTGNMGGEYSLAGPVFAVWDRWITSNFFLSAG